MITTRDRAKVGDQIIDLAFNGHTMLYNVIKIENNYPIVSQWDAVCIDDCLACSNGETLPDW